jgi:asparagine synthase (glutamine-hydrolysing)
MCGIVGGNLFTNRAQVENAQELISHRGKDASCAYSVNGVWLGHNRLAIQDLDSKANQPMVDNLNSCRLVFNGELWKRTITDYAYLRREFPFRTKNSDTELLLYMYRNFRKDMFSHLDGMFSFAIHDHEEQEIILARDWVGRLPLYYLHKYGGLAFSSELKALTESFPDAAKEIQVVKPGSYCVYDVKTGELTTKQYYNIVENVCESDSELDKVTYQIKNRLYNAVANELVADVPVCTILSGGIDSVLITYLLKQHIPDLKAYVVSVGGGNKDDLHFARMAAEWMDIPLEEVIVTKSDINKRLKDSIWAAEMDSWTQVTPAVAQLFLAKKISDDGFKVVFGGEGADELFGSYGNIQKMYYKQDTNKEARISLIRNLHKNNLIRTNKAMMYGGTVELRTPFLDREFAEYALSVVTIDAKHHKHTNGFTDIDWSNKGHMKFPLRKAFECLLAEGMPEELLYRKKETFQVGCHTDYLRDEKEKMTNIYNKLFKFPVVKKEKSKMVESKILLKDKADMKGIEEYLDFPVHVLGAMEKPKFDTNTIELLSTKFSKVGKTTLQKFPNLKAVIVRGHGHDLINKKMCDESGVRIYKLNQYTESCAQWCADKITQGSVVVYGMGGVIGSHLENILTLKGIEHFGIGSDVEIGSDDVKNVKTIISCIPYDKFEYKSNENFFCKKLFDVYPSSIDFISISRAPTHNNDDLINLLTNQKLRNVYIDTVASHRRDELLMFDSFDYTEHSAWKHVIQDDKVVWDKLDKVIKTVVG